MCLTGGERLHGLKDARQDTEWGDLGTDFHVGSKSLRDLRILSQPSHGQTGALGLTCSPTTSWGWGPCPQKWEPSWHRDKRGDVWVPQRTAAPHFLTLLSSSHDDRQSLWGQNSSCAISSPVSDDQLRATYPSPSTEDTIGPGWLPRDSLRWINQVLTVRDLFLKDAEHLNCRNSLDTFGLQI